MIQVTSKIIKLITTIIIIVVVYLAVDCHSIVNTNSSYYTIPWDQVPTDPSDIHEHSSQFGSCICKRLTNQCTPNCCCDSDCTAADLKLFTYCDYERSRRQVDFKCVSNNVPFYHNLPKNIKVQKEAKSNSDVPLFCVYYDAGASRGKYYSQLSGFTLKDIKLTVSREKKQKYRRVVRFAENYEIAKTEEVRDHYQSGDPIHIAPVVGDVLMVSSNSFLKLPKRVFSEMCDDSVTAKFLENVEESKCNRRIIDLENACNTYLDVAAFTTNIEIPNAPLATSNISSYLNVTVKTVLRKGPSEEYLTELPVTSYDSDICYNALQSVSFFVKYTQSGLIDWVQADLVIQDVPKSAADNLYEMSYGIQFLNGNKTRDDIQSGFVRKNSGSPGYLRSSPILAGKFISQSNESDASSKSAVNQIRQGLSVYTGLDCLKRQRSYLQFEDNLVTSCRLKLTLAELEAVCILNEMDFLLELEDEVNAIGKFGNADYLNINEWLTVQQSDNPASTWDSLTNTCHSIAAGLEYHFIIARAAAKNNEQWKIVGASRSRIASKWRFTKSNPLDKQSFWIQYRVQFVRLPSQESTLRVSKIPNLLPSLPEDIFYPFSLLKSSAHKLERTNPLLFILFILLLFCELMIQ